jgi:NitT/TauT family transport system substrate-binding protein
MHCSPLKKLLISCACIVFCFAVAKSARSEDKLTITLLPIIDSFPYHVAESRGLFKKYGVEVKLVRAASGFLRDQLMQAGSVDAMLNELHSATVFNRDEPRVKVLAEVRRARPGHPLFRVLAAPKSGITSLDGLKGTATAVSKNTIIEYVAHRLFSKAGLKDDEIVLTSVPSIPERFQLLMQGKLKAAVLPEPLASGAVKAGAGSVADDAEHPLYAVSALTFSMQAVKEKQAEVLAFLKAWDEAAEMINADPESFRDLMVKSVRMPPGVQKSYKIPPFSRGVVPSREQWDDVQSWMLAKGLIDEAVAYETSVSAAYLP